MTELEKLGYVKSVNKEKQFIEWNNYMQDVRILFNKATNTIYIRQIEKRRPITIFPNEMVALLKDIGYTK